MALFLFLCCVSITLSLSPQLTRALETNPGTPTPPADVRSASGPYQGTPGAYGATGDQGWPGYPGQPGFPGQKGEKGIRGPDGYPGIPGTPGKRGDMGTPGYPGSYGAKGNKGDSGFPGTPGRTGNMGPTGDMGYPGNPGMPGKLGIKGPPGPQGYPGKNGDDASFEPYSARVTFFAIHSQTSGIPYCPKGTTFLWTGYSFFASKKDYASHMQDLGYAGSCLRKFSASPFVDCSSENVCYGGSNYLRSTWLSGYDYPPGEKSYRSYPSENTISRCVVCETVSTVIAVHSQAYSIPPCPPYWKGLWTGYSFGMYIEHQGIGVGGEDLLSPGSCLQIFRAVPFVDCKDDGTCAPGYNHQATWLAAIPEGYAYSKPTKSAWKDYSVAEGISKCQVCIKVAGTFNPSSYGNSNDPKYGAGPPVNYPPAQVVTNGQGLGPIGRPQSDGSYPPGYGPEWSAPSIPQYGPGTGSPLNIPRTAQSPMVPGQQSAVAPPQSIPNFSATANSMTVALPLPTSTTFGPSSSSLALAGIGMDVATSPSSQGAAGFPATGQSTNFSVPPDNVATETITEPNTSTASDTTAASTVTQADLSSDASKPSTEAGQAVSHADLSSAVPGFVPNTLVPTASSSESSSALPSANGDGVENGVTTSTAVQSVTESTVSLSPTSNQRSE